MRARHFLALFAAGLTAATVAGCDSGDDGTGGGGAGGDGGGGTGGTTTSMPMTTSMMMTTSTPTPTGDGNDSFAEAIDATVIEAGAMATIDDFVAGALDPTATDQDYFKFTLAQETALFITTVAKTAQGSPGPFADGYPDLVITIYDSNEKQIAQNDDPIPRDTQDSSLYTLLPAGDYFIKVEEFCQVLGASAESCNDQYFADIVEPSYLMGIFELADSSDGTVQEGNDTDVPQAIADTEYVENTDGTGYFAISIQGTFKGAMDEDVYTFTVPDAIPVSDGRDTANFEIFPTGENGNGSTTPTGLIWIEDAMGNVVAQSDGTKLDPIDGYPISAPLVFGQEYSLHVKSGGTPAAGGNNFYYVLHYRSGSNPVEVGDMAPGNNDSIANAETLTLAMTAGGFDAGFVAGDISAPADVDFYKLDLAPAAGDLMFVSCSAQRIGSGLRNLKITVIDGDTMMPIAGGTATETIDAIATVQDLDPGNTTNFIIKVEAAQDANVTGTYYQCGSGFIPPAP